jgi:hypothetical protein
MRTSNKILLTGFVASVLIITGVYVTLYAKIKNGDLVVLRNAEPPPVLEKHATPNIRHVVVTGLGECHIMHSETARLELPKDWNQHLVWRVVGDSLIIGGSRNKGYTRTVQVLLPVNLYLPQDATVYANYSNLYIGGADDSAKAVSLVVNTANSTIFISPNLRAGWKALWAKLQITSRDGGINVSPDAEITEMDLVLNNSAFTDEGARFGSLSVKADSNSTISLRQGSLEKLKLNKP